ncbi:hypothetical protein Q9S36_31140 [Microbacterium sp. ARD31]|uniref:hypothetical protein n=1 Tax=Microbacterium sp. ARD31 TaxID=2962576 RepID=UPI0028828B57|nr:hypothetical protein [Microbacterium sp. ARD31]MDT0184647.1 hypothetical protein [Microbacterium sp. ARD31]
MTSGGPHLSRRDAERLLEDPAAHGSALGTVLAAAAAPPRPAELRREPAAVAAFHTARLAPAPAVRHHVVPPERLGGRGASRLVVASATVLALAAGGLLVADTQWLGDLSGAVSGGTSQSVADASDGSSPTEPSPADPRSTKPPTADNRSPRSADPAPGSGRLLDRACRDVLAGRAPDPAAVRTVRRLTGVSSGRAEVVALCRDLREEDR